MDDDNPADHTMVLRCERKNKPSNIRWAQKMFGDETMEKTLDDVLDEKIDGLVKKSEKSGIPYGILKQVYNRGMVPWRTGHSRHYTQQ